MEGTAPPPSKVKGQLPLLPPMFSIPDYSISLLSNIFKVLESLVFNEIISHINTSISPLQFGFSSTLQEMLLFMGSKAS